MRVGWVSSIKELDQSLISEYARGCMPHKHIEGRKQRRPELTDAEVKAILTQAMVEAEATGAAVYAYHKTDLLPTNKDRLPPERLRAWNAAISEYFQLFACPKQESLPRNVCGLSSLQALDLFQV